MAVAIAFFLRRCPIRRPSWRPPRPTWPRLVSSLVVEPPDPADATPAREALDAIDDGLPGDAVALQLGRMLPAGADAVAILRARAERSSTAGG